jgi:hypothetical protein
MSVVNGGKPHAGKAPQVSHQNQPKKHIGEKTEHLKKSSQKNKAIKNRMKRRIFSRKFAHVQIGRN